MRVLEIVIGQYLVWRSSLDLIFSTRPSASELEVRFSGTSMLFFMRMPKSCDKNIIELR